MIKSDLTARSLDVAISEVNRFLALFGLNDRSLPVLAITGFRDATSQEWPIAGENADQRVLAVVQVFRDEMSDNSEFLLVTSGMCPCSGVESGLRNTGTYCMDCIGIVDLPEYMMNALRVLCEAFEPHLYGVAPYAADVTDAGQALYRHVQVTKRTKLVERVDRTNCEYRTIKHAETDSSYEVLCDQKVSVAALIDGNEFYVCQEHAMVLFGYNVKLERLQAKS
jgi:hypothetical protein